MRDFVEAPLDVYSLSHTTLEGPDPLSTHMIFKASEYLVVTVYVLNQQPGHRRFDTFEEFAVLRDAFLEDCLKCLASPPAPPERQ